MELVYLWVEKYKNIEKQGFNFSPRFDCKYDGETLTIDETEDFIDGFFGENINVTTIVGKNGSGKSSLLEVLSNKYTFIVYFENNEIFISDDIKINNCTPYISTKKSTSLDYTVFKTRSMIINDFSSLTSIYLKTILEYLEQDCLGCAEAFIFQKQAQMFFHAKRQLKNIIFPKNILFSFFSRSGFDDYSNVFDRYHPLFTNVSKLPLSEEIYLFGFDEMYRITEDENVKISIQRFLQKNNAILSAKKLFSMYKQELTQKDNILLYETIHNLCIFFERYPEYTHKEEKNTEIRWLKIPLHYVDDNFLYQYESMINGKKDYVRYIEYVFDRTFSSGELTMINILVEIYHDLMHNENISFIYIDEGENFLHPNWQKNYLSYVLQFLADNFPERNLHIVFTTHSPFLLSDIPKQNIIFLDKDEKGNCKVVNGLKDKKQTFGANIHTLLSDSFFMEDGLMGEFAKEKINKAIRILNGINPSKEDLAYCEQIISIIGEPIVKNQLQKMLDSKRLSEVDALKEEMICIQDRIKKLEDD